MKLTNKKPASKAKVGGGKLKKLSWKKAGFLSLVGILLLTTVGYTGYTMVKSRELKAQAAGYTAISTPYANRGVTFSGCKTLVKSGFGDLYKVNIIAVRTTTRVTSWGTITIRKVNGNDSYFNTTTVSSWWGNVSSTSIYTSVPLGDRIHIYFALDHKTNGDGYTYTQYGQGLPVGWLADC